MPKLLQFTVNAEVLKRELGFPDSVTVLQVVVPEYEEESLIFTVLDNALPGEVTTPVEAKAIMTWTTDDMCGHVVERRVEWEL